MRYEVTASDGTKVRMNAPEGYREEFLVKMADEFLASKEKERIALASGRRGMFFSNVKEMEDYKRRKAEEAKAAEARNQRLQEEAARRELIQSADSLYERDARKDRIRSVLSDRGVPDEASVPENLRRNLFNRVSDEKAPPIESLSDLRPKGLENAFLEFAAGVNRGAVGIADMPAELFNAISSVAGSDVRAAKIGEMLPSIKEATQGGYMPEGGLRTLTGLAGEFSTPGALAAGVTRSRSASSAIDQADDVAAGVAASDRPDDVAAAVGSSSRREPGAATNEFNELFDETRGQQFDVPSPAALDVGDVIPAPASSRPSQIPSPEDADDALFENLSFFDQPERPIRPQRVTQVQELPSQEVRSPDALRQEVQAPGSLRQEVQTELAAPSVALPARVQESVSSRLPSDSAVEPPVQPEAAPPLDPMQGLQQFPGLPRIETPPPDSSGSRPTAFTPLWGQMPSTPTDAALQSIGAARTADNRRFYELSRQIPAPMDLTLGMRTGDPTHIRFERETAKSSAGAPISERYAELNLRIDQNLDEFIDASGAEIRENIPDSGGALRREVVAALKRRQKSVQNAYKKAREAGEMSSPLDVSPIDNVLMELRPEGETVAPIVKYAAQKIKSLKEINGSDNINANDLEKLRQAINSNAGFEGSNAHNAAKIKTAIDKVLDGEVGDLYKKARAARLRLADDFENNSLIASLSQTRPGTKEYALAVEHIIRKSIISDSSPVASLKKLKSMMNRSKGGKKAWQEVEGGVLQTIRNDIFKGQAVDSMGNVIASPSKLNAIINNLDRSGKLDVIFGDRKADQLRTLNEVVQRFFATPSGAVNTSGTASVLMDAIEAMAAGSPIPGPTSAWVAVRGAVQDKKLKAKIKKHLEPPRFDGD